MSEKYWIPAVVAAAALASWWLTELVRTHAISRSMLAMPSDRGLHETPIPRGGGLAIVIVMLCFLVVAGALNVLAWSVVIAIAGGGAAVAFIGWRDDVTSISALPRLLVHFAAAIWAVMWLGGLPSLDFGAKRFEFGLLGSVVAIVGIVWTTNLFNFMDGSDGIVAVEVISVGLIGGVLLTARGTPGLAGIAFVLAAATLGFLRWNWSPAAIFLGDVGSGFVGFCIATLAIASENVRSVPVAIWAILCCVFLVDATLTLLRRLRQGYWREPHRTHAYQLAIQGGWSHRAVATWVAGLNLVFGVVAIGASLRALPLGPSFLAVVLVCVAFYGAVLGRYKIGSGLAAEKGTN